MATIEIRVPASLEAELKELLEETLEYFAEHGHKIVITTVPDDQPPTNPEPPAQNESCYPSEFGPIGYKKFVRFVEGYRFNLFTLSFKGSIPFLRIRIYMGYAFIGMGRYEEVSYEELIKSQPRISFYFLSIPFVHFKEALLEPYPRQAHGVVRSYDLKSKIYYLLFQRYPRLGVETLTYEDELIARMGWNGKCPQK